MAFVLLRGRDRNIVSVRRPRFYDGLNSVNEDVDMLDIREAEEIHSLNCVGVRRGKNADGVDGLVHMDLVRSGLYGRRDMKNAYCVKWTGGECCVRLAEDAYYMT